MRKLKGSFTIEAAIIVPLSMFIIMAFINISFLAHDMVIMKTEGDNYILKSFASAAESYEKDDDDDPTARQTILKYRAIADGIDFITEGG